LGIASRTPIHQGTVAPAAQEVSVASVGLSDTGAGASRIGQLVRTARRHEGAVSQVRPSLVRQGLLRPFDEFDLVVLVAIGRLVASLMLMNEVSLVQGAAGCRCSSRFRSSLRS
jgi:hypothetical protein